MYGEKLKRIRKHFAVTQDKMAEFLGIATRTYTSYERDENNPPYSMLILLCKNHDVNLNWFVADVGEMFNPPNFAESYREMLEEIGNHRNSFPLSKDKSASKYYANKCDLRSEVIQILKDEGIIK